MLLQHVMHTVWLCSQVFCARLGSVGSTPTTDSGRAASRERQAQPNQKTSSTNHKKDHNTCCWHQIVLLR